MNNKKRFFDICISLLLAFVLMPILLAIVIAIKMTSPGPVIFRQKRIGQGGKIFMINKFRKFPSDWGTKGPSVTLQFDSRMTKIGRVLERTKLDELPQLWNIFVGEMSFVGPRPETVNWHHLFEGPFEAVLQYKPGIFGPNQTKYRNESAMYPAGVDPEKHYEEVLFPDKASRDLGYFKESNMVKDIYWILSGTFALLFSALIWRKSTKTSILMFLNDVAAIIVGWCTAHLLKYGGSFERVSDKQLFLLGLAVLPVVALVMLAVARIYRHPVKYFSETDFYRMVGCACVVWISTAFILGFLLKSTSSLLLAVSCVISIVFMSLPRVIYQVLCKARVHHARRADRRKNSRVNIVVCGVNSQSIGLCNFLTSGFPRSNVLGLVDSDTELVRREVHGFEVLGTFDDLQLLDEKFSIQHLWISSEVDDLAQTRLIRWGKSKGIAVVPLDQVDLFQPFVVADRRHYQKNPAVTTGDITSTSKSNEQNITEIELEATI